MSLFYTLVTLILRQRIGKLQLWVTFFMRQLAPISSSPTFSDLYYNNNNDFISNKGGRDKTLPQLTATSVLFQAHS